MPRSAADVDLVFDDVEGTLGGLDVLVNGAGIPGPTGSIDTIDRQAWERTVAVNLHSQFYFARRAVPLLKRSRINPSLIAMGSVAGGPGSAFRAPYLSTKWAIVGLVKSLAIELRPAGIRVNAILQQPLGGRLAPVVGRQRDCRAGPLSLLAGGPQPDRTGHQRRRQRGVHAGVKPSTCENQAQPGRTTVSLPRRQQLSVKITDEACERFRHLARAHGLTLGDLFEQALDAWEMQRGLERRFDQRDRPA